MKQVITGNSASAYGAKLARVDVIAAYPITPQTTIVETIATMVANGEFDTQFVKVESEHSAMAACISACNVGARAYTASSSHGMLLMHEMLIWASGARTPVVMSNVNRANGPPWSVWADHHDAMAQRDTGWMQIYCSDNQEVLDTILMAYKVGEKKHIMLPSMVLEDAFILSHTMEPVDIPDQDVVDAFLPKFESDSILDVDNPKGFGSLVMPEQYLEFRYKIAKAMDDARNELRTVYKEFEETFGRRYDMLELYKCDDADAVLMIAGSVASTAMDVVDSLRARGHRVGLARIRVFRPFPYEEIRDLAKKVNTIGVCDRSYTFGYGGGMAAEIKGALYGSSAPVIKNYIMGLGGRDVTPEVLERLYMDILDVKEKGLDHEIQWIDVLGVE